MVEFALGTNRAIVRQDNVLGDGEPQSRAARFAGASLVYPVEALEQPRQVLERDSRAEVANIKFNPMLCPPRSQHQSPTRSGILQSVVDEVREDLVDRFAVSANQIWRRVLHL